MRALLGLSFLLFVLLGSPHRTIGQDSAFIYTQQALALYKRNEKDSAELFATRAIMLDSIDPIVNGLSEYVQGAILCLRYRFDQAKPHLLKAIPLLEQTDDYPEQLGDAYLKAGGALKDPTTRLAFYDKALEQFLPLGDSVKLASTFLDMGIVHYRQGNLEQFRRLSQRGLSWISGQGRGGISARLKFAMGRYFKAIGNIDAGILYMGEALEETLEVAPNDPFLFNVCREYGQLLSDAERYDEAVRVTRIPLLPDSVNKSRHRISAEADMWLDIGIAYAKQGQTDSAEAAYITAIESLLSYGDNHLFASYPLSELAYLHLTLGELKQARSYRDRAMEIVKAEKTYVHPDYAMLSLKMAMVHNGLGAPQAALMSLDSGLVALGYNLSDPSDYSSIYRYDLAAELLNYKSHLLSQNQQFAGLRTDHYRDHMRFLDSLQSRRMDPSTRIAIISDNYGVYELAISHAFDEFNASNDPRHIYEAFTISERSKDQLFKQFLLKNRLRHDVNIPEEYLDREKELNDRLIGLRLKLIGLPESEPLHQELEEERRQIVVDILELQHLMNDPYLGPMLMMDNTSEVINGFRSDMNADAVVCHFFDGTDRDFLFVMSQNALSGYELKCDDELESFIELVSKPQSGEDWVRASAQLYDELSEAMDAFPSGIEHLTVIPDGKWAQVPFEALITDHTGKQLKYLIENFKIAYGNSIRSLETDYGSGDATKLLAAWAPEYPPIDLATADSTGSELYADLVRSGEYALPGAKREAKTVANIFGGKTYVGQNASESIFREEADQFRILHLSMHALLEDRDPNFSRLLFTLTDDDRNDDFLYASELSILPLNAELAVLSACNTGSGKNIKGEGVMSLSRAFHYAGVPSVIHSLWKVPDEATADIMTSFYEELKTGADKASALRDAKLRYINSVIAAEESHPYYWAGFVANGDISAIEISERQWTHYVLLLLAALVVILVISRRKLNF